MTKKEKGLLVFALAALALWVLARRRQAVQITATVGGRPVDLDKSYVPGEILGPSIAGTCPVGFHSFGYADAPTALCARDALYSL